MRFFISYRRGDTDYLVTFLRDVLQELSTTSTVFVDHGSISLGADFRAVIDSELFAADIVLVSIGPRWQSERLISDDDVVRYEILRALELGKRIVPILQQGAEMPASDGLPAELAWLANANAFELTGPGSLHADAQRLFNQVTERVPELSELRGQIWAHYEQKDLDQLLKAADAAWATYATRPSPGLADCCRTAALALVRDGRVQGLRDLWTVRAITTAYRAGAPHALAATLLPHFFRAVEVSDFESARDVMSEIRALIVADDAAAQLPPRSMMVRMYHEKVAYSYFCECRYDDAFAHYEKAREAARSGSDRRGLLKISGGIANCHFAAGRVEQAIELTREVLDGAIACGYQDLAEAGEHNFAVFTGVAPGTVQPYEVT